MLLHLCILLCCLALPACTGEAAPPAAAPAGPAAPAPVIIDVRTPEEFAAGHIAGALNLPVERIATDIAQAVPARATPIIVYCASGWRSANAAQTLVKLGYPTVEDGGSLRAMRKRFPH